MKITYNINLDGRVFTIDEDAFRLLNDYLETLKNAFENSSDGEIVNDIEARISEIFQSEREAGRQVVTLSEVENVITRIGHPEEIVTEVDIDLNSANDIAGEEIISSEVTPPPFIPNGEKINKRLYRDSQNGMIGGVCAGLAEYLNIDVTWVRLAAVFLCFASFSTIALVYIILWIVLPNVETPLQRMELTGQQPTLQNIGQSVKRFFNGENSNRNANYPKTEQPQGGGKKFFDNLAVFFGVLAKIILVLILIILIPTVIGLALGLVACLIALIGLAFAGIAMIPIPAMTGLNTQDLILSILCAIGLILVIGLPLYAVIMLILKRPNGAMKKATKTTLIIIWIIAFILFIVTSGILWINFWSCPPAII